MIIGIFIVLLFTSIFCFMSIIKNNYNIKESNMNYLNEKFIMNNITLIGVVIKDIEIRFIEGSEIKYANFSIAVDRKYNNKDGLPVIDIISIETRGSLVAFCELNLEKGRLVSIIGSLEINQLEDKKYLKLNAKELQLLEKKMKLQIDYINIII